MHVFEHIGVILCVINLLYVLVGNLLLQRIGSIWIGVKSPKRFFPSSSYLNFYSSKFVVASLLFLFCI